MSGALISFCVLQETSWNFERPPGPRQLPLHLLRGQSDLLRLRGQRRESDPLLLL